MVLILVPVLSSESVANAPASSQDHVQLLTTLSVMVEALRTLLSLQVNKCARYYVPHLQNGSLQRVLHLYKHHFL